MPRRTKQVEWPQLYEIIMRKVREAVQSINGDQVEMLVNAISECRRSGGRIFFAASGRSLNVLRNFGCRLAMEPLGMFTHDLCGSTFPPIKHDDLLIACSASGYTQYVIDFVADWKGLNKKIILITANNDEKDADNLLWRTVEKKVLVPSISAKYKMMRKNKKKLDTYDVKEDLSGKPYEDLGVGHFVFELATLTLLEAAHHELINRDQASK